MSIFIFILHFMAALGFLSLSAAIIVAAHAISFAVQRVFV